MAPSVKQLWQRFESWIQDNAPDLADGLQPGASGDTIRAAERTLGLRFPADVREALALHDGDDETGVIGGWSLLSVEGILVEASRMEELLPEFANSQADESRYVKRGWWNPKWIPLVSSGSGHLIVADLDPTDAGAVGQIVLFYHDDGARRHLAPSYAAWLSAIVRDLEAGVYTYADEEFNWEAFLRSAAEGADDYYPERGAPESGREPEANGEPGPLPMVDAYDARNEAIKAFRADEEDRAATLFRKAIAIGRSRGEAYVVRISVHAWANLLARASRPDDGAAILRAHLEQSPDDGESWSLLGQFVYETGDAAEGYALCVRGLELAPKCALGYYQRACAAVRLERFDDAVADIREAIRLDPELRQSISTDTDFIDLRPLADFQQAVRES